MMSFIGQGIGLLIVYLSDFSNMTQVLIGHAVYGIFNCGFPLSLSMVADSVDYQELKSGVRTDGTAYATYGLATKIGNAVGSSLGFLLITAFGYVANAEQSVSTQNGINLTVNLLPAILFFLAAVVLLLWKKKDAEFDAIREKLNQQKAAASSEAEHA